MGIIFLIGYGDWEKDFGGDTNTTYYAIPTYCGIFLIPHRRIIPSPLPPGALGDWCISIPYKTLEKLKEDFSDSFLLVAPGQMIGLYSGGNGLIKDGIKEAFQRIIYPYRVYLMKLEET